MSDPRCTICGAEAYWQVNPDFHLCRFHNTEYVDGKSLYTLAEENRLSKVNTLSEQPTPMPEPQPTDGPSIHDLVVADCQTTEARTIILQRRAFGLDKYGTLLQAHNGRPVLDDLVMELADAVCYARQAFEEELVPEVIYGMLLAQFESAVSRNALYKEIDNR